MVVQYLFLILFSNVPLVIGWYSASYGPPKDHHQQHTCNCNCNFPRPMSYYDPYGNQQGMVCIPVPITVQGMYPQNLGTPGYIPGRFPPDMRHSGVLGTPEGHSYPPGYGSASGGFGSALGPQPPPGFPSDMRHFGVLGTPEGHSYPPGYNSASGGFGSAIGPQPPPGFPSDMRRPGYMLSPEQPSYRPGHGNVPGVIVPVQSLQPPLGVSGRPVGPHLQGDTPKSHSTPALSAGPDPAGFKIGGPGSESSTTQFPELSTKPPL